MADIKLLIIAIVIVIIGFVIWNLPVQMKGAWVLDYIGAGVVLAGVILGFYWLYLYASHKQT